MNAGIEPLEDKHGLTVFSKCRQGWKGPILLKLGRKSNEEHRYGSTGERRWLVGGSQPQDAAAETWVQVDFHKL